jgi:protoporphyrinogen oxidase
LINHFLINNIVYVEEDKKTLVIIGAGPAGLTAAITALRLSKGKLIPIVLEKDSTYIGGISRTVDFKGYKFDIGGHRFFSKSQEITKFWDEIGGEDMLERPRLSRIYYEKKFFDYPISPINAFVNLGPRQSFLILLSYLRAKISPYKNPQTFEEWVTNQFGKKLYSMFFKSYTEKVWGIPCDKISADFAAQRIKGLSLTSLVIDTLRSFLGIKNKKVIKTLIEKFKYPKRGPGQFWEKAASIVNTEGGQVILDRNVKKINYDNRNKKIISITAENSSGNTFEYKADYFISTMPVADLIKAFGADVPEEYVKASQKLGYRDFLTVALIVKKEFVFADNWIYIHEPDVKLGRIQNFKNWSSFMIPDSQTTSLGLEYFCNEGDEFWNMKDKDLINLAKEELEKIGLVKKELVVDGTVVRMPKAYPVYDEDYKDTVLKVREFTDPISNLFLVGRNGMHKYNNQDHSMMTGIISIRKMLGETSLDPWNVNSDAEYHETSENK